MKKSLGLICVLVAGITLVTGCGSLLSPQSGGTGTSSGAPQVTGKLQINLTDAPAKEDIEEVWLTIRGISVHEPRNENVTEMSQEQKPGNETNQKENETESDNGWVSMPLVGDARFNLLALQNGIQTNAAMGDLAPGKYTQIRLDVTKVEVKVEGDEVLKEAKLPSNKLKFIHPFKIAGGQITEILFDFDALNSINVTGNGQYMCKPVVKLTTTKEPKAADRLEIITPSLPNGEIAIAFEPTIISATGGTLPYTWTISAGTVPTGLTFNGTNGTIAGTPAIAGDFTFTVNVEDGSSPVKKSETKAFTINIASEHALQIVTTSLPEGTEQVPYPSGEGVKAISGNGTYTWSMSEGNTLPNGLSLNPVTGVISGTPTTKGNYNFTVSVKDTAGPPANIGTQSLTIRINKEIVP